MASKKKRPIALTLTKSLSMSSNSTRLLPYLVLGGQESVSDMSTLDLLGITHILNVSAECKCWFEDKIKYYRVPIEDEPGANAAAHFEDAHSFLNAVRLLCLGGERAAAMVHCKTGMSRSTTMVLCHMIMTENMLQYIAEFTEKQHMLADASQNSLFPHRARRQMTLRDALAYIRERRPRASPNAGFMQQLVELEARIHDGEVSIDLEKYKKDRFGDVRTFCIGEIDPIAGYTGSSASAINDDAFLLSGAKPADTGCVSTNTLPAITVSETKPAPTEMVVPSLPPRHAADGDTSNDADALTPAIPLFASPNADSSTNTPQPTPMASGRRKADKYTFEEDAAGADAAVGVEEKPDVIGTSATETTTTALSNTELDSLSAHSGAVRRRSAVGDLPDVHPPVRSGRRSDISAGHVTQAIIDMGLTDAPPHQTRQTEQQSMEAPQRKAGRRASLEAFTEGHGPVTTASSVIAAARSDLQADAPDSQSLVAPGASKPVGSRAFALEGDALDSLVAAGTSKPVGGRGTALDGRRPILLDAIDNSAASRDQDSDFIGGRSSRHFAGGATSSLHMSSAQRLSPRVDEVPGLARLSVLGQALRPTSVSPLSSASSASRPQLPGLHPSPSTVSTSALLRSGRTGSAGFSRTLAGQSPSSGSNDSFQLFIGGTSAQIKQK